MKMKQFYRTITKLFILSIDVKFGNYLFNCDPTHVLLKMFFGYCAGIITVELPI